MVVSSIGGFLRRTYADKFKRYLIVVLLIIGILLISGSFNGGSGGVIEDDGKVHFFFSPTCPHCAAQEIFNEDLMIKYPGVEFVYHDVTNPSEAMLYKEFIKKYKVNMKYLSVPATFFGDYYFFGFGAAETTGIQIDEDLQDWIKGEENSVVSRESSEFNGIIDLPFLGEVDVMDFSLPVLAVVLGLVDGFNPCAMWVLVYLISLIVVLDDKRKIWLLVGSFVFASGILYFLFMTAWLNVFLLIGYIKSLTIVIGLFALGVGVNDLKTYFTTKGALECEIDDVESKKRTMGRMQKIVESPLTWITVLGIIGLAFVVNSIEFACSAALPAIFTQVLSLSGLSGLQYYLYILMYVLFFMLDDLIIFGLAAFAVTGTAIGHKYARYCKLVGGAVLVVLGLILVFMPGMLGSLG